MHGTSSSRRGFTLIEVGISLSILVVLLIAVGQVILAGSRAFRAGTADDALSMRARRALDRVADEIEMAGMGSLVPVPIPPLGSSTLDVRTPTGLVGNVVQFGNITRIQLRPDPADPANGLDDDGDGLIDEERIECIKDVGLPSERSVNLAEDVSRFLEGEVGGNGLDDNGNGLRDEGGLSFVLEGERLTVRLSLLGLDAERRSITRTVETVIKIRN